MAELEPDDPRHGTLNGYNNLECRCRACCSANTQYHAAYLRRVRNTGLLTSESVVHGTAYRYDVGCRCDECRAAHNKKSRDNKARRRRESAAAQQSAPMSMSDRH